MKKIIILTSFLTLSVGVFNQKTPTYIQFPAKSEKKTATDINLISHPTAREFRKNLSNAFSTKKVNFGGKYILIQWGCGTGCIQAAMIDVKTGNVYFPKILQGVTQAYNEAFSKHEMLEFRHNSNLIVIFGAVGNNFNDESTYLFQGISYYQWTGKDFKLLKFIRK